MRYLIGALRLVGIVFGLEILVLLLLAGGPGLLAKVQADDPAATSVAWIPVVQFDQTPTPIPTPDLPPSPYEAYLAITPQGGINASTFNSDSFILRNKATNGESIVFVRLDLSTAVFPNMVFDPFGKGGDTLAKDLKVDHKGGAGLSGHSYAGDHGGGYDILELTFNSFDPGDEFRFSVDVDPNSIRGVGAPGPHESGSVSGLELMGSTVTVRYEGGRELSNQTSPIPGSDSGSEVTLRAGLPAAPTLSVLGIESTPVTVSAAAQKVIVSGAALQPASLLVLEGGMFLDGVPGGGFNVEPYDANSLVAIQAHEVQTRHNGQVVVDVTLMRSLTEGGINHLAAVFDNHFGARGSVSVPLRLELAP